MNGSSRLMSVEEILGYDEATGEPVTLAETLSNDREDPSVIGARNVDWQTFLRTQNRLGRDIIRCMLEGRSIRALRRWGKVGYERILLQKRKTAAALKDFMGPNIIQEINRLPQWKGNLRASREKLACRERHRGI